MLRDKEIREPLFDFLEQTYGKTRMIEEKMIGRSRADMMMVTPSALYGIEIKSDADSYARLAGQIRDYDCYYDYNIIAVGTRHAMHIREHVPDYWGIITVEETGEGPDFYVLREPLSCPKTDWERKLSLLWRPELAQLQEWNGMPKYKDKSKAFVCRKIAERIPDKLAEKLLKEQVKKREQLKRRSRRKRKLT